MGLFGNNTTQTTTTAPWKGAQPYLTTIMDQASKLYKNNAGYKAPNFQTWVPFADQTKTALGGIQNLASQGNPLAGQSMGAISGILGGDINQKYNDLYNSASNDVWSQNVQNQSDKIANDVQQQFSNMGRYGSAANTDALVNQLGDYRTKALADYQMQNIANQRGILGDQTTSQLNAVAAAPGAYEQQYQPFERLAQVGAANEDLATRKLQARLDKFNTNQNQRWNRLNAFQGAVTGASGGTGTTSTVQPSNWLGGILGGGLLGSQIGGQISGLGAGGGALGGGLLGLLGSI